jgi:large subunit ribosomal protein L13
MKKKKTPPRPPPQGINATGLRLRLVDATDQVIGRLAARIATVLQGKDKPTYRPGADAGDVVVVINAASASFTGRKWGDKVYRWHTGFPGGLKERSAAETAAKDPGEPLRRAVYGMLPKNRLRDARARKLRVFAGPDHPFAGDPRLVPWSPPPRKLRVKEPVVELPPGFVPLNPAAFERRFGRSGGGGGQ